MNWKREGIKEQILAEINGSTPSYASITNTKEFSVTGGVSMTWDFFNNATEDEVFTVVEMQYTTHTMGG